MSINLNNLNHNINFKTMFIKIINNSVRDGLYTKTFIKIIKNFVIQAIKAINNVYKYIKIIKKISCLVVCSFDKISNHRFINKRKRVRFSTIPSI